MTQTIRRLGWATDIHLNFVNLPQWEAFIEQAQRANIDGLLLTGDISEADDVAWQLERLVGALGCPVYFVLGNHDFYRGSIANVRDTVRAASAAYPQLHFLTAAEPLRLGAEWALCGDDGWADARLGDFFNSPIRLNDFRLIADFEALDDHSIYRFLRRAGAATALRLHSQLQTACALSRRILVLTHIPPFRESCWYEGRHGDDNWAPFFTCYSAGWALRRFCNAHPEHEVLVLCGHTHHAGRSKMAHNLTVWTGAAEYGSPQLCATLDLDNFQFPENDWTFIP